MSQPLLYFIRHGETDWNAEGRLQGQHDTPLNKVGIAQAVRCGDILRTLLEREGRDPQTFDYVASPLSRTRKTMELVRGELALDPAGYRTDARLVELSFGRWEGFTFAELKAREADTRVLATREHDKWGFVPPGGESYADLLVRVERLACWRRARHDRGVAWRRRAHPHRPFRGRAAGGGADPQYRPGRRLSVCARPADALRLA